MTKTVDLILDERGRTNGDYKQMANAIQSIKAVINSHAVTGKFSNAQREALDMIAHKLGRILAGDPDVDDHWNDIAGYAQLAVRSKRTIL